MAKSAEEPCLVPLGLRDVRLVHADSTCEILQGDAVIKPTDVDPSRISWPNERCQTVRWDGASKQIKALGFPRDEMTRMRDFRYYTRINGEPIYGICDSERPGETRLELASPLSLGSSLQLCAIDEPYGYERLPCLG